MIETALAAIVIAFIVSNVAWMLFSQRLINKLMSRDFPEYVASRVQAKSADLLRAKGPEKPKPETFDHPKEDLRVLTSQILR